MNEHRWSVVSLCSAILVGSWGCDISTRVRSGGEGASSNVAENGEGTGSAACTPIPDGNPCTTDSCVDGAPSYEAVVDGTACDDGDGCTVDETCQAGACLGASLSCPGGETCDAGACVPICSGALPPPVVPAIPTVPPLNSVTMADVNSDGKNDLVITSNIDFGADVHGVGVLINEGQGKFAPIVYYPVGSHPEFAEVTDINGDQKPDLVISNYGYPGSITLLLNQGDGTFGNRVDYGEHATFDLAMIDLNADGALDFIGARWTLDVHMNQGDGTFIVTQSYAPPSTYPVRVRAADMNSDGKLDLVVAGFGTLDVLFNDGSSDITQWKSFSRTVPESLDQMVVADFDDDKNLDVIATFQGLLGVFRNPGDGTLVDHGQHVIGEWPAGLATADFNGDNKLDLVITEQKSQSISVFLNQGGAVFAPDVTYTIEGSPPGHHPRALVAGDLDEDGKPDVALVSCGNNVLEVLLNTCSP